VLIEPRWLALRGGTTSYRFHIRNEPRRRTLLRCDAQRACCRAHHGGMTLVCATSRANASCGIALERDALRLRHRRHRLGIETAAWHHRATSATSRMLQNMATARIGSALLRQSSRVNDEAAGARRVWRGCVANQHQHRRQRGMALAATTRRHSVAGISP